jgi:hypothetical protein
MSDLGRHAEAEECYCAAIRLNSVDCRPHANLRTTLAAVGRDEEAMAAFDESLRIDPHNLEGRFGRRCRVGPGRLRGMKEMINFG